MACRERLETYLNEHRVPFTIKPHERAYTAQELADAAHVPGRLVAKVVIAFADGTPVMLVLPAPERVSLTGAAAVVGAREVRLATEREMESLFPDCEVGAQPPFGNLYGIGVYVESDLTADPEIVFPVGTHRDLMRLRFDDFQRLVRPVVGRIAERPALARQ